MRDPTTQGAIVSRTLPANAASVAKNEARKEVRRRDDALREHVGTNPTIEAVIEVFPEFFPTSQMNERQVRQYATSVVAGRPHFI